MGLTGNKTDTTGLPKPTLYQFLSEKNLKKYPFISKVEVIWLPNRWPNYTIDTEDYRLRIVESSSLYTSFQGLLKNYMDEGIPMQVSILDSDGTFDIDKIPEKQCKWEPLSSTGVKMTQLTKLWVPKSSTKKDV